MPDRKSRTIRAGLRRTAVLAAACVSWASFGCRQNARQAEVDVTEEARRQLVGTSELRLRFQRAPGERSLAFRKAHVPFEQWRTSARQKLAELLRFSRPGPANVRELRQFEYQGVTVHVFVMDVDGTLSIPGYLLVPDDRMPRLGAVMAIHGHGSVEPAIGFGDDYHHSFALELAKAGHVVLAPELRGFGTLGHPNAELDRGRLDYWVHSSGKNYTLVTDGLLYGRPIIGETVEDLLRWEDWLASTRGVRELDVAGISYGGDLSIVYPAFSERIRRIFVSGSLGSFSAIFKQSYNAPAHTIPGILNWMDRSDIAGISAPRPIAVHYGEFDRPGPDNAAAAYNDTVEPALDELREIYSAAGGARPGVQLIVTPRLGHEMDVEALLRFLGSEHSESGGTPEGASAK